jgi:hypothetical protein
MQPDRREDLNQLRLALGSADLSVDLEITEYMPGRRGIGLVENISIFVTGAVSSAVLSKIAEDIYSQAKKWARVRFARKRSESEHGTARPQSFTIYGPDDKVLKTWKIDKDGEHGG